MSSFKSIHLNQAIRADIQSSMIEASRLNAMLGIK
jgi:hypothetical protein